MPKKPKGNGHSAYDNVIDVYNCKYSLIISIRPLLVENGRLENRGRRPRSVEFVGHFPSGIFIPLNQAYTDIMPDLRDIYSFFIITVISAYKESIELLTGLDISIKNPIFSSYVGSSVSSTSFEFCSPEPPTPLSSTGFTSLNSISSEMTPLVPTTEPGDDAFDDLMLEPGDEMDIFSMDKNPITTPMSAFECI